MNSAVAWKAESSAYGGAGRPQTAGAYRWVPTLAKRARECRPLARAPFVSARERSLPRADRTPRLGATNTKPSSAEFSWIRRNRKAISRHTITGAVPWHCQITIGIFGRSATERPARPADLLPQARKAA